MKQYMYALYSEYVGAYDKPFVHDYEPEQAKESFRRTILQDPDGAFKNFAHEKILCFIGTWDDQSGEFIPTCSNEEKRIVDLATFFPVGYLAAHARKDNL